MRNTELVKQIKPFVMRWIDESGGGATGAPSPHDLNSAHHSGSLADSQAPQFLKTDGSRGLTGNLAVSAGATVDGVDISAHAGDANAHHAQSHEIVSGDHYDTGLTVGYVIQATAADAFAWAQLQHSDLGGVSADQHHAGLVALIGDSGTATPNGSDQVQVAGGNGLVSTGAGNAVTLAVDLHTTWSGLEFDTSQLRVDLDAAFTWAALHTFNAGARIAAGQTLQFGTDVALSRSAADVLALAGGDTLRSTTYASGVSGWAIEGSGDAEFNNVRVRGALTCAVFVKDLIEARAGSMLVTKSGGVLANDMAVPGSGTWYCFVEDPPGGGYLFENNDICRVKTEYASGIGDIWFTVSARTDMGDGRQRYTCTYASGTRSITYPAGGPVLDYGVSSDGGILLTADDGVGNAPFMSIFTHAGSPWSSLTEHLRLGNLNGLADYASDKYGIFIGNYGTNKWMAYDPTNGMRIHGNGVIDGTLTAEKLAIGDLGMFSSSQGVLLLGPGCPITATSWTSLRGYMATISGAFHTVQGKWASTQGLMIEEARTNYVAYASFEAWSGGAPTGWTAYGTPTPTQETTIVHHGASACYIVDDAAGDLEGYYQDITGLTPSSSYRVSAWVYVVSGTASLYAFDGGGYSSAVSTGTSTVGRWVRLEVTKVCPAGGSIRVLVGGYTGNNTVIFDMVQAELGTYATSDIYYSMGSGYTGTISTASVRAATVLSVARAGKLAVPGPHTIHVVAYVPWAYNDSRVHVLMDSGDLANENRVTLYTNGSGVLVATVYGDTAGGYRLLSYALTGSFGSGRFHSIDLTMASSGTPTGLYLDGVLVDSSYYEGGTWAAPTTWGTNIFLGSNRGGAGSESWDGAICEFATFAVELTAEEIARIYETGRELADTGAANAPGIYVVDGKFRISSSTGTTRIELTADELAGYNGGTKQFYLSAVDGKAYAGAGATILDANGPSVVVSTAYSDTRAYRLIDSSANLLATLRGYKAGTDFISELAGRALTSYDTRLVLQSYSAASRTSEVYLSTQRSTYTGSQIRLRTFSGTDSGDILFYLDGAQELELQEGYANFAGDVVAQGGLQAGNLGTVNPPTGTLVLYDGISAPSAITNGVIIYVDAADGDLKARYSDGVIKTIVVDT